MKRGLTFSMVVPVAVLVACSTTSPPPSSVAPTAQSAAQQAAPTVQAAATQAAPTVQALATQVAPTVQAAAPTVQAAATQVAPTVQAAATQAAPTVQAAATQLAPTAQALATTGAGAAATAVTNAPVRITGASLAADGPSVTIQNTSSQAVDLTGWTLRVGAAAVRLPANTRAPAGESLTVHATTGTSSARDVYLGQPPAMLSQEMRPGARVTLEDPSGSTIAALTVPGA